MHSQLQSAVQKRQQLSLESLCKKFESQVCKVEGPKGQLCQQACIQPELLSWSKDAAAWQKQHFSTVLTILYSNVLGALKAEHTHIHVCLTAI